jgi:hypothetical protein
MGSVFIPPEGSVVALMFQHGSRDSIYYIGCTWMPKRDDSSTSDTNFTPDRETYRYDVGARNGDIETGIKDNLLPPWNNESYYGKDLSPAGSSDGAIEITADDSQNIRVVGDLVQERSGLSGDGYSTRGWRSEDIPNIYGIKTPEKHFIQFVDGSYDVKATSKKLYGKRMVLQSSKSSILIMKDDSDQTAEEIYQHPYWDSKNDKGAIGTTWFTKTGGNHKIELNHTGVQLQSFGGGRIIIDDKLKGDLKPYQNQWNSVWPPQTKDGKILYRTMVRLESHTEHRITLSDHHDEDSFVRSPKDGIFLSSACGHFIGMVDHTDQNGKAGVSRQIHIKSTSGHELLMTDYQCTVKAPGHRATGVYPGVNQRGYRDDGVYDSPNFKADGKGSDEQIAVKLKSGFGQYLIFSDTGTQKEVSNQYILLSNAPGYNDPHNFLLMRQPENKLVHLSCAGERLTTVEYNYNRITQKNEGLTCVTGNQVHTVEQGNMIDVALQKNITHYCAIGNHVIYCREGVHTTYALKGTFHMSYRQKHRIMGGIPPDGKSATPDPVFPVCLYIKDGTPLTGIPSKWLEAN